MLCFTNAQQAEVGQAYATYVGRGAGLRDLECPRSSGPVAQGVRAQKARGGNGETASVTKEDDSPQGEGRSEAEAGTVRVGQLPGRYYNLTG